MPKIPKLDELKSNIPGMLDKFRSMLDALTGPGKADVTEEALAKESDPLKVKLMELELLINQLNDIQVIQNRTINTLRIKQTELAKFLEKQKIVQEKIVKETKLSDTDTNTPPET